MPEFIRKCFYLRAGWVGTLRDAQQIEAFVRNGLQSKYAVRIGFALEYRITKMVKDLGLSCQKGKVSITENKEVDIAIPNTEEPRVLIMSSYALTIASSQSSRANEQELMYQAIQRIIIGNEPV